MVLYKVAIITAFVRRDVLADVRTCVPIAMVLNALKFLLSEEHIFG